MARMLVTYGSRRGSTAEIAEWIAGTMRDRGLAVDLIPASQVVDVRGYDAVVIGGAIYNNRWHRDARRFARRHAATLRARSVWLFSSGPLDGSAAERDIPPVPGARRWLDRLEAEEHVTFGGRLARDARGFAAALLARSMSGDHRDRERITGWAGRICDQLAGPAGGSRPSPPGDRRWTAGR
ncbi:flavodoxin [Sphaerisporangium rufum]|uniref:Flavodoxin n=1 Tax=Sphaerisporangium rufum TaxID=1381558 RepID=A0A919QZ41_9ACTN|nr:flavodoxin domain-containing protein [Sphaerisporangium rufum]GII76714.1 flavodoxin [Sphaerisporangium rufum]